MSSGKVPLLQYDRSKSVRSACPLAFSRMFSGFKSLRCSGGFASAHILGRINMPSKSWLDQRQTAHRAYGHQRRHSSNNRHSITVRSLTRALSSAYVVAN